MSRSELAREPFALFAFVLPENILILFIQHALLMKPVKPVFGHRPDIQCYCSDNLDLTRIFFVQIYMLLAYGKSEQKNLTPQQLKVLKTLVEREFGS